VLCGFTECEQIAAFSRGFRQLTQGLNAERFAIIFRNDFEASRPVIFGIGLGEVGESHLLFR
jgi:hypothetical protein